MTELKHRKMIEGLVDAMGNYLPGDREEVRRRTAMLIDRVIDEKALVYLKKKFLLQGYKSIQPIVNEMKSVGEVWKEEAAEKAMLSKAKKRKSGDKKAKGAELQEERAENHS